MRSYFSRMHKEKGSGRALELDLVSFREDLWFYILLAFYFRILVLYTTDFNPRINKDVKLGSFPVWISLGARSDFNR